VLLKIMVPRLDHSHPSKRLDQCVLVGCNQFFHRRKCNLIHVCVGGGGVRKKRQQISIKILNR
jgi:hypothetical protein